MHGMVDAGFFGYPGEIDDGFFGRTGDLVFLIACGTLRASLKLSYIFSFSRELAQTTNETAWRTAVYNL